MRTSFLEIYMIHQLIFNTLLGCQPKSEPQVDLPPQQPNSEESKSETLPPTDSNPETSAPKNSEESKEKPIIVLHEELPTAKEANPKNNFYTGTVTLTMISHASTASDFALCRKLCTWTNEMANKSLARIENCTLDLIADWQEQYKAHQETPNSSTIVNPTVIGAVSCNAAIRTIRKGRKALAQTKGSSVSDGWGGYFARAAQEEMTAVVAFQEFLTHLQQSNAPQELQERCAQIVQEEHRHTLMMAALAKRCGEDSVLVDIPQQKQVSTFALAQHNAIAGCIEETWAAVLAHYQAQNAPRFQPMFQTIAKDEAGHAQFSWDAHKWLLSQLSTSEQEQIIQQMRARLKTPLPYQLNPELGEMDEATHTQAWIQFQQQVETLIAA